MAHQKVKLAILDDYQGIAAAKFARLASRLDITSYPDTLDTRDEAQRAALIERLQPYTLISSMRERTPFTADIVSTLPNLKYLLNTSSRNRSIDLEACNERGITVTGTTGREAQTSVSSTSQHTWALILGLARNIARDDAAIKNGGWQGSLGVGLPGKTLGVLGLGKLGLETARIGIVAFGLRVKAWSSSLTQESADEKAAALGLPAGSFEVASCKEDLFRTADILSVHYVLSDRSRAIVGAKELAQMKPTALLINSSRGPLIDEAAVLEVLKQGKIRGIALDVFEPEPLPKDSEWRTTKWGQDGRSEVLLTPHMGYGEEETINGWYEEQVANVERWLNGEEVKWRMA
ncbi:hypothetical protein AJ80_07452 [Polytolypa hystricis UAMH7299]|uniref:D-isomer specific 2-hydroxyacid dehydrogenase NAD-binding domain-containing protein n=1 Tax=Polytolypa hystricis (strain UAMH7299) TaxID=1447883 RepID=A0A2B7XPB2_POLH7|nr:hypothetical protein AJ80_07452 [Polytolypa hystricis UAMH7299]